VSEVAFIFIYFVCLFVVINKDENEEEEEDEILAELERKQAELATIVSRDVVSGRPAAWQGSE